jgi:hypothetical protein
METSEGGRINHLRKMETVSKFPKKLEQLKRRLNKENVLFSYIFHVMQIIPPPFPSR